MNNPQVFQDFLTNLSIKNKEEISNRYKRITKVLNLNYYNSDSEINNSLQVGSYGRKTAVNGVSDLDMVYELPESLFSKYNSYRYNGQSALLQDVKNVILKTYSTTNIRGDGQVVVVQFSNHLIEVCPCFKQKDLSYIYPDCNNGGVWKKTHPRPEINEMNSFNLTTNGNFKNLAKIIRAWKNKCGVKIGGLLIDTLCYEFLKNESDYQKINYSDYPIMIREFFKYLKDYSQERVCWYAPGSNQKVYKKKNSNFISKAKKAYNTVVEAIEKNETNGVYAIWRKIFGRVFPYPQEIKETTLDYTPNEEFIEDFYPVDITNVLRIECEVTQAGFRTEYLSKMLNKLRVQKKLRFFIDYTDVEKPYMVKWKVRNKGEIAKRRNNFRGQILDDQGHGVRNETSNFAGPHYVECFLIKNGVCVARDRIDVPISNM